MTKFIHGIDENSVEISGQKRAETKLAILIFDGAKEVWIPKSQIEDIEDQGKGVVVITIPEWLAEEKELI